MAACRSEGIPIADPGAPEGAVEITGLIGC